MLPPRTHKPSKHLVHHVTSLPRHGRKCNIVQCQAREYALIPNPCGNAAAAAAAAAAAPGNWSRLACAHAHARCERAISKPTQALVQIALRRLGAIAVNTRALEGTAQTLHAAASEKPLGTGKQSARGAPPSPPLLSSSPLSSGSGPGVPACVRRPGVSAQPGKTANSASVAEHRLSLSERWRRCTAERRGIRGQHRPPKSIHGTRSCQHAGQVAWRTLVAAAAAAAALYHLQGRHLAWEATKTCCARLHSQTARASAWRLADVTCHSQAVQNRSQRTPGQRVWFSLISLIKRTAGAHPHGRPRCRVRPNCRC